MKEDTPIFKSTITIAKRNTIETDGNDNVELKISKQDDFGNEYFVKENVDEKVLEWEITWRQQEVDRLTNEINNLTDKLNLIK